MAKSFLNGRTLILILRILLDSKLSTYLWDSSVVQTIERSIEFFLAHSMVSIVKSFIKLNKLDPPPWRSMLFIDFFFFTSLFFSWPKSANSGPINHFCDLLFWNFRSISGLLVKIMLAERFFKWSSMAMIKKPSSLKYFSHLKPKEYESIKTEWISFFFSFATSNLNDLLVFSKYMGVSSLIIFLWKFLCLSSRAR